MCVCVCVCVCICVCVWMVARRNRRSPSKQTQIDYSQLGNQERVLLSRGIVLLQVAVLVECCHILREASRLNGVSNEISLGS
ncbi:hypothetical protein GGS21DRAFT_522685 [Xylaria nigripes]|nr:hypothetical protein GGS21DRAFT_522685 [Xylaria nigripes]